MQNSEESLISEEESLVSDQESLISDQESLISVQENLLSEQENSPSEQSKKERPTRPKIEIPDVALEKLYTKLHHVRKLFHRLVKDSKILVTRKLITQLKKSRDSSVTEKPNDRKKRTIEEMESELETFKSMDKEALSLEFFFKFLEKFMKKTKYRHAPSSEKLDQIWDKLKLDFDYQPHSPDNSLMFSCQHKIESCKLFVQGKSDILDSLHKILDKGIVAERIAKKIQKKEIRQEKLQKRREKKRKTQELNVPWVSEGDFSDVSYSDFSEPEEVKPKKNRPGQRARQKKWETLYGEQANHVAKRKAEEKPKKIWPKKQKMEESQPKKPKVEKIHPSWAAKKQQAISVTDFKGTKVTFDSDNE